MIKFFYKEGTVGMREVIQTVHAPKPGGPYSQGVKFGDLVFVSGQDGIHPNGELAGETIADVVSMTCHLAELNEETVEEFNQVYAQFFKDV